MRVLALILTAFAVLASQASAASLIITPTLSTVALGDQVQVDITVEGLGDGASPSIGSYDIDILYDPASLSLASSVIGTSGSVFSSELDTFIGGSAKIIDTSVVGMVGLFEEALDFFSLETQQPAAFTLATLVFDTLALGTSIVDASVNSVITADGVTALGLQVSSATVTVVPLPGALPLMLSALIGGFGLRHFCRRG